MKAWLKEYKSVILAIFALLGLLLLPVFLFIIFSLIGGRNTCAPTFTERLDNDYSDCVQEEPTVKSTTPEPKPPTVKSLYKRTNQERKKRGIAPLKLDTRLNQSAELKAKDMEENDYYGHLNPNTGRQGYTYIFDTGAKCLYVSENLDTNYSRNPIADFMASKPHKAAILDPRYESVGFAIVDKYVVQHFCDEY